MSLENCTSTGCGHLGVMNIQKDITKAPTAIQTHQNHQNLVAGVLVSQSENATLAQLQLPAVTEVEIQSTNLVQFLKDHGLTFCVEYFFFEKKRYDRKRKLDVSSLLGEFELKKTVI